MVNVKLRARFDLVGGKQEIQKAVIHGLVIFFESIMGSVSKELEIKTKRILELGLMSQKGREGIPYYESLKGGFGISNLRAEFGISNPKDVDDLINIWTSFVRVTPGRVIGDKNGIKTGLQIKLMSNAYSNVNITQGTAKGEKLPWVQWLLEEGGRVIIGDYKIMYRLGRGRTGQAIMINPSKSLNRWQVPVEFQGTLKDNWVTQTIDSITPDIELAMYKILMGKL